ncbi:OprO/OprP family phosphate-selective porin [Thalassotalea sp. PLHSN55]|uniref:OprO/OprP family phosphate-selective porin n=1 Tax=Thalassotalea sp. PLHSN55 TaxID=3435888 RepID=UPI003F86C546
MNKQTKRYQLEHCSTSNAKAVVKPLPYTLAILPLLVSINVQASDNFSPQNYLNGFLMFDHVVDQPNIFTGEDTAEGESQIRRSRLNLESQLNGSWRIRLHSAYDRGEYRLLDSYIRYNGLDAFNVTIGKQKEFFGFENIMSARDMTLMERSLITSAIVPGRKPGVNFSGEKHKFNWQLGYYLENDNSDTNAVTGRLTWTGWQQPESTFHLGMAFSERDYDGKQYSISEVLDITIDDSIVDYGSVTAESVSLTGLEMMWQKKGFTSLAEWQQASITDVANDLYEYQGGYVQLSYLLSGLNRDYAKGLLRKLATDNEWELSMRWSQMNLIIEELETETLTFGINYHLSSNTKIMLNYMKTKYNENYVEENDNQRFSLRAQYVF